MEHELEERLQNLKDDEEIEATFRKKKKSKPPPYIMVGNGMSTKDFPEDVVVDAFQVFSELSPAQQQLFVGLKDVLVQVRLRDYYAKRTPENPNLIWLDNLDEFQQSIRTRMGQNRNGTILEEKGILKKIKTGKYMFNPYLFPPASDFKRVAEIWENLPTK